MKILRLILGDQLNLRHSWFAEKSDQTIYVMMEIRPETDYVKHHLQKLLGVLGAMRSFAKAIENEGHRIIYLKLTDKNNRHDFAANLREIIAANGIEKFEYQEPDEYRVDQVLKNACEKSGVKFERVSSEHFLIGRNHVKKFFGDKQFLMENFYRDMRRKYGILMNNNKPLGGRWNFDVKNRKKYPGDPPIPPPLTFDHDLKDVFDDLKAAGVEWFGNADPEHFSYPQNREEALKLLGYFTDKLLPHFGTYQDAMTEASEVLFHSRLSFALNTKMLHPLEVIQSAEAILKHSDKEPELQQVEGFIRQILGWREYVRGVYWAKMPAYEKMNYFGHENPLPKFFWTGDTRMNCLKHAIRQSLDTAYAHHIQRLMITGNFALLTQTDPDEVDAWYLGVYIDAFQWVELTNTRGMSQFADGGIMATKPYVSSANYIHKMSDYCKGCHYDHKKRTGQKACPFNSLYWNFFDAHKEKLGKNHRLGMVYRNLEKFSPEEKSEILQQAQKYLEKIDTL